MKTHHIILLGFFYLTMPAAITQDSVMVKKPAPGVQKSAPMPTRRGKGTATPMPSPHYRSRMVPMPTDTTSGRSRRDTTR